MTYPSFFARYGRKPVPGQDFDPDNICQDDHEYLTGTGRYSDNPEPVVLKLASQMDNNTRIACAISGWVAVDGNCGELNRDSKPIHLTKSNGRRKAGRPSFYYLFGTGLLNAPRFEAFSDEEAVELANDYLFAG